MRRHMAVEKMQCNSGELIVQKIEILKIQQQRQIENHPKQYQ
jgi:hypothetical protein